MNAAPSLPELQQSFADAVLGTGRIPDDWIAGNGLNPQARLQIYRNLILNNHSAALRTAYPAVLKLVGEDFFDAAAARYLQARGSGSGNLQDYGAAFPEFLADMPEAADLAYLPDVARLEWARQESFLAADAPPLAPETLAQIPEDRFAELALALHPSMRLTVSPHPIWDIWMLCQQPAPERRELSGAGQAVLIWRAERQLAMQPLTDGEEGFIAALLDGKPVTVAYEDASTADLSFDVSACLQWLLQSGLIIYLITHQPRDTHVQPL